MKKYFCFALAVLVLLAGSAFGATTTQTKLSAAVTSTGATNIRVASATGFTADSTFVFVDSEQMAVTAVNGLSITVRRGSGSTVANTHASGVRVFVGPSTAYIDYPLDPLGSCTAANYPYLPLLNTRTGNSVDCVSSNWTRANSVFVTISLQAPQTTGGGNGLTGKIVLANATTVSGVYIAGTFGQVTTGTATFSGTSMAGIYGKLDITGGTLSAGNIAAVQANIVGASAGTYAVLNGIYVESAGGGRINSYLRGYGNASYIFDFEASAVATSLTGAGSSCTTAGWLSVNVDNVQRYINLCSAH